MRGSRRGEMISRCVVESGTSSYYTAIRDATDEPVLKEIAGRIAADEYRHYKLFYETMNAQAEPDLPFWRKLMVAVGAHQRIRRRRTRLCLLLRQVTAASTEASKAL